MSTIEVLQAQRVQQKVDFLDLCYRVMTGAQVDPDEQVAILRAASMTQTDLDHTLGRAELARGYEESIVDCERLLAAEEAKGQNDMAIVHRRELRELRAKLSELQGQSPGLPALKTPA